MTNKKFLQQQNITDISEMSQQKPDQKYETMRILRMKDLVKKTSLSRAHLYSMLQKNSKNFDPNSPSRIKLGGKCIGFLESDVDRWLISLAEKSLANMGDAA
jgi:prophage regulatory protein